MSPRELTIDGVRIADDTDCYVIAEIGHNHQGSVEQAKRMFDEAKECDTTRFRHFFHEMLGRGVYPPPSQLEASFVSLAHTTDDIAEVSSAVEESLKQGALQSTGQVG